MIFLFLVQLPSNILYLLNNIDAIKFNNYILLLLIYEGNYLEEEDEDTHTFIYLLYNNLIQLLVGRVLVIFYMHVFQEF